MEIDCRHFVTGLALAALAPFVFVAPGRSTPFVRVGQAFTQHSPYGFPSLLAMVTTRRWLMCQASTK
jgi:hypothetical protein